MTHRIEQVESTLTRAISKVLSRDISDPRIAGMVSITRIEVTSNMHDARVYVSIIPDKYGNFIHSGTIHFVGLPFKLTCS